MRGVSWAMAAAAVLAGWSSLASAADPPFQIKLLPGYAHEPKQGFDSVVGVITKKDGPQIMYELGPVPKPGGLAVGGSFSDRPKQMRPELREWYKEQVVGGRQMHLALGKDKGLYVSFPESGANFMAQVKGLDDLADVLLMLSTYAPDQAK